MTQPFISGGECRLYYGTHEVGAASKTWNLVKHVGDVDIGGMEQNGYEVKIRGMEWTPKVPTNKGTPTISFEVVESNVSSTLQLREDFMNKTIREYMEVSGDIANGGTLLTTYFAAYVSKFERSAKLDEAVKYSVELTFALAIDDNEDPISVVMEDQTFGGSGGGGGGGGATGGGGG